MARMHKCNKCGKWKKGYVIIGMWLENYIVEEFENGSVGASAMEVMENKQICKDCSNEIKSMFEESE